MEMLLFFTSTQCDETYGFTLIFNEPVSHLLLYTFTVFRGLLSFILDLRSFPDNDSSLLITKQR